MASKPRKEADVCKHCWEWRTAPGRMERDEFCETCCYCGEPKP